MVVLDPWVFPLSPPSPVAQRHASTAVCGSTSNLQPLLLFVEACDSRPSRPSHFPTTSIGIGRRESVLYQSHERVGQAWRFTACETRAEMVLEDMSILGLIPRHNPSSYHDPKNRQSENPQGALENSWRRGINGRKGYTKSRQPSPSASAACLVGGKAKSNSSRQEKKENRNR